MLQSILGSPDAAPSSAPYREIDDTRALRIARAPLRAEPAVVKFLDHQRIAARIERG
jgi:hypothetical protein